MNEEIGVEDLDKLREAERAAKERIGATSGKDPEKPAWLQRLESFQIDLTKDVDPKELEAMDRRARELDFQRRDARVTETCRSIPALYDLHLSHPELAKRVHRKFAIAESQLALMHPGIVWRGQSGSGKTTLACATARTWAQVNAGGLLVFARASQLATASRYHALGEGRPELLERAMRADLFILDEIGEPMRTAQWDDVAEVIFSRYEQLRPTWVTTWLSFAQMNEHYGDGFARRLLERSTVINCGDA